MKKFQKPKEERINRIIKNIPNQFFDGKRKDDVSNTRTMKVGVELNDELKQKLDVLMNDTDLKRREILKNLMEIFYNNPQELIEKAGKITNKINKKTGEVLENHKFSSQKLYGVLYKNYAKGKSLKNYPSAVFYESVLSNIAKEVCSFLDKYYTIQEGINKTISDNDKRTKKEITIDLITLPEKVSNKKESEEYNKIVRQNNILINLYNQKVKTDEELPFLKDLKGFPSFPLIEKRKELDYSELNKLFEPYLENAKLFWDTINNKQMQEAMKHFYGRIIYKWFEYYYKIEADEPSKENSFEYKLNNWSPNNINIILERIDKKINRIETYTNQDKKAKIEWLRGKSLIIFEYLRQSSKEEFAKVRGEFDLKSSMNAGFISKDNIERKVYEITGFSENKKATILVDDTDKKHFKYSLAFNVSKDHSGFKISDDGKFKGYLTCGGSKKKPKDGEENEKKNTQLKNISLDTVGTSILPLKFGKRYAREYLYNNELYFENKGITLNNARIIQEGNKYFVAITFTKLKGNKPNKEFFDNFKYKAIIGVDRGEKLPVAIVITDMEGRVIEQPILEVCKDFAEKQEKIAKQKKEQSSKTGNYDAKLKKKAKNLSKATIEKIGAELLYYATKYKGLIVLEDLAREFGIDPIMAKRQYTKIEDFLSRKLKENGLMWGNILTNTKSGLLGKVIAQHTSKTCSDCGCVFAAEKIRALEPYLKEDNIYYITFEGKEISLNINYKIWIRSKGREESFNANEEIIKLKEKDTIKNKKRIEKVLLNALNPRKTQAEFFCPICEHKENADMQAGLNIARRWLFIKSPEKIEYDKKKDTKNKISYWQAWENFCKRNKDLWNQKN
ncbi:MAG TPA: hypothetical protein VLL98_02065 [Rickettsiales bacterium]|nr:hypothetical protein [Rickettsiales bacterium]